MTRPSVNVIVPFRGTTAEADDVLDAFSRLQLRGGDELYVVDNSPTSVVGPRPGVEVLRAPRLASSYYARNVGAAQAACDWLLFLDADTRPPPRLLDEYFAKQIPADCAIVAGEVDGAPHQTALTARHARAREHLGTEANLVKRGPHPAGATANLMVRRSAWEELGGFHEVRSGADLEFCWRAQEIGWGFTLRSGARVEHLHTEALAPTLRKVARYGPGQSWANRRYPGSAPNPPLLKELARAIAGVVIWPLLLQFERAAFKALDGAWIGAYTRGYYFGDNRAQPLQRQARAMDQASREGIALVADSFPERGHPSVERALQLMSDRQLVETIAVRRPRRVDRRAFEAGLPISYFEDLSPLGRAQSLVWLVVLHPVRAMRMLASRDRAPTLAAWAARRAGRASVGRLDEHGGESPLGHGVRVLTGLPRVANTEQ